MDRRGFLGAGAALLLPRRVGSARLNARPGTPARPLAPGRHELTSADGRAHLLVIPRAIDAARPAPLIVALHGAGGSPAGPVRLLGDFAEQRGMVLFAPRSDAHTWDGILARFGPAVGSYGPDVTAIDEMLRTVFDGVRVDPRRICLEGFSDGASYALALGRVNGDLFTHVAALSPGFIPEFEDRPRGRPRFFVSHGMRDAVLPFWRTRDLIVPTLRRERYSVEFREFDGPHAVPGDIVAAAIEWFL